jgi:hypothetical protein
VNGHKGVASPKKARHHTKTLAYRLSECSLPFEQRVVLLHAQVRHSIPILIGGPMGFEWADLVACGYATDATLKTTSGARKKVDRYRLALPEWHPGIVIHKSLTIPRISIDPRSSSCQGVRTVAPMAQSNIGSVLLGHDLIQ